MWRGLYSRNCISAMSLTGFHLMPHHKPNNFIFSRTYYPDIWLLVCVFFEKYLKGAIINQLEARYNCVCNLIKMNEWTHLTGDTCKSHRETSNESIYLMNMLITL